MIFSISKSHSCGPYRLQGFDHVCLINGQQKYLIIFSQRTIQPLGSAVATTTTKFPGGPLNPFNINPDFSTYHSYFESAVTNAGVSPASVYSDPNLLHLYETALFNAIYPNGQVRQEINSIVSHLIILYIIITHIHNNHHVLIDYSQLPEPDARRGACGCLCRPAQVVSRTLTPAHAQSHSRLTFLT